MNREQQINDAIALLEDALRKGEIEENHATSSEDNDWHMVAYGMMFSPYYKYRAKPKPAEFWINEYAEGVYGSPHDSEREAKEVSQRGKFCRCIHVREVTDE